MRKLPGSLGLGSLLPSNAEPAQGSPDSEEWDHSRLEAVLESFEKLASMFKLLGDMPFIYQGTLGWYASQYFIFARETG
jgi:hypothetical protein